MACGDGAPDGCGGVSSVGSQNKKDQPRSNRVGPLEKQMVPVLSELAFALQQIGNLLQSHLLEGGPCRISVFRIVSFEFVEA